MEESDSPEHGAAYKLLETGSLVAFDVVDRHIKPSPDGGFVRMEIQLGETDEDGDRSDDQEWGAFGFIFCLATLSFHDARPRGNSDIDFADQDEFTVADLHDSLRYSRLGLRFTADYVRGRCMKTDITIRPDGTATLETQNRGESAPRWLEMLRGRRHLQSMGSRR